MTPIINAENLGKKYFIRNGKAPRYRSLRDEIMMFVRQGPKREKFQEFWALSEIDFKINQGEKVGIIGKNGAGKSTLLKLLSRVTEPTTGQIKVRGRISSLLEVGTGFHPELTGRENIFLNGVILGMSRHEIRKKFDEIVYFAGVEQFLETQVKHYSSGMYMRLAFSVAAHLEPEVLVIDEVLAVGDADFQKKCLGKMEDISSSGRTVVFVSHSLQTVTSLCNRCILLDKGQILMDGHPSKVILEYLGGGHGVGRVNFTSLSKPIGDEYVQLLFGEITDKEKNTLIETELGKPVNIRMGFRILKNSNHKFIPNFHFTVAGGVYAFVSSPEIISELPVGDYIAECDIPQNLLNEGTYSVGLALVSYEPGLSVHYFEQSALNINVRDSFHENNSRFGYGNVIPGVVRPKLSWSVKQIS